MMQKNQWLTIKECLDVCEEMGFSRTSKTIRSWARNGHVEARKKSTANGEMWILDKSSLDTKIQTEIEYRDQMEAVQTRADASEQVRTGADRSEPVQTGSSTVEQPSQNNGQNYRVSEGADPSEPRSNTSDQVRVRELESEVMRLKIDVGWRDKMLDKLGDENKTGQETLHAQARYIGHLESDLMRLGGKPDQTFLAAPKPQNRQQPVVEPEVVHPNRPHPDQQAFRPGMMG